MLFRHVGAGLAVPSTPCPHCAADVPLAGDRAVCPACQKPLRFVDVPERPCDGCGGPVPLLEKDLARCLRCGLVQPEDPDRPVVHETTCVRCRRRVRIDAETTRVTCPHCHTALRLVDTV